MPPGRKTLRDEEDSSNKKPRTRTAAEIAAEEERRRRVAEPQPWEVRSQRRKREEDEEEDAAPAAGEPEGEEEGWSTCDEDDEVDEPFDEMVEEEIIDEGAEEAEEAEEEEDGAGAAEGDEAPTTRGSRQLGEMKNVRFAPEVEEMLQGKKPLPDAEESAESKVWRGGSLTEGEELDYSNAAYDTFFQLRSEWPCLSFDILRDSEGEGRTKYPLSMMFVAGTQADSANKNELVVLRVTNICKTKHDLADDESEDSFLGDHENSDDDADEGEEINGGEPIVDSKAISHHGAVNRLRSCPQVPSMYLSWSEAGRVQVFDVQSEMRAMADFSNWSKEQAAAAVAGKGNKPQNSQPLKFTSSSSTHKVEGYGMDWSPVQQGVFATGDCSGALFVWRPAEGGRWAPSAAGNTNQYSIEEIKWSAIQADYLVTACAGGAMMVWDSRDLKRPKLVWQADSTDINVCDWNKATKSSHLLVTGAEGGQVAIWDLRNVQSLGARATPLQTLKYHNGQKVTSVEFNQHNESVLAVCSDDGQCTLWDLSLERDPDEERAVLGELFGRQDVSNLPDQLMFVHQGLVHPKEVHFHPQIPGMVITTDFNGFHLFKPMNWRSLMK
jgi:ribosome assembly protein RRB1